MSEADAALARPATLCAFCPKLCRSACPVSEAEKRETVTPWAKMSLVHLGRTGQVPLNQVGAEKALEACTGCGACVEQCAHGNPVGETLFAARAVAETPRSKRYGEAFKRTGDVKGRDMSALIAGLQTNPTAKVAYFPGCARLNGTGSEGRNAVEKDLEALAIAFGASVPVTMVTQGAQCCGYPVYADGNVELVEENFLKMAEIFAGHEVVITPDPGCAWMFATVRETLVGKVGLGKGGHTFPQVLPLVEALGARAERFAGAAAGVVVRYHDPCYLARRGRTFDAPRRLLQSATGKMPLEFVRHHDDADCAGGGGLYPVSNPEGSKEVARRRASPQMQGPEPAEIIVTACPSARRNFERAGVRARDIVDVVLGSL
jgi:Fe-S oxidoreductase